MNQKLKLHTLSVRQFSFFFVTLCDGSENRNPSHGHLMRTALTSKKLWSAQKPCPPDIKDFVHKGQPRESSFEDLSCT